MKVMCVRCGKKVRADKSAFCLVVINKNNSIYADLHYSSELAGSEVALHVNGDRECGKEIALYRKQMLGKLELPNGCDVSVLDSY